MMKNEIPDAAGKHVPLERDLSRNVLDSLTAEIAVLDRNGTIVDVNEAWRKFADENDGDAALTGIGVNYLDVCRAAKSEDFDLAQCAAQGIESVISGAQEVFRLEYPCHSTSMKRWFLLYVSPLKCKERLVQTTHVSITDRKLAELQLVEAERLAAIGQAMRGLSHEGRNALQRAQAHMGLLRLHVDQNTEALELLQRIENAQGHLLGLFEEVRSYTEPIELLLDHDELRRVVETTWSSLQFKPANFSLVHYCEGIDTRCQVDVDSIAQLLRLIFDNALAACGDQGKIEVTYSRELLDNRSCTTMVVSDNGPGIPTQEWEHVFEPFYTTKTQGTGLGLAVAKRIVKAHQGRIQLGAPKLGGTSVYISLPTEVPDA